MKITQMSSIPENSNPFWHDMYHMGRYMGKNVCVMFKNFEQDECPYLIVVDMTNGHRLKIDLTEEEEVSERSKIFTQVCNDRDNVPTDHSEREIGRTR
jgi:hypothetical protein